MRNISFFNFFVMITILKLDSVISSNQSNNGYEILPLGENEIETNQTLTLFQNNDTNTTTNNRNKILSQTSSSIGRQHICSSCKTNEAYRNQTIMEIKKQILKKLNMPNGPPTTFQKDIDSDVLNQLVGLHKDTHPNFSSFPNQPRSFDEVDSNFQAIIAELRK